MSEKTLPRKYIVNEQGGASAVVIGDHDNSLSAVFDLAQELYPVNPDATLDSVECLTVWSPPNHRGKTAVRINCETDQFVDGFVNVASLPVKLL